MPQYGAKQIPSNSFTIAVLGDGAVGKSCSTLRFLFDRFDDEHDATIEDFYSTQMTIDNEQAFISITDTSGQDEYADLHDSYYRSCDGFLLVYDVTRRSSFEEAQKQYNNIMLVKARHESVPALFFGNKTDLVESNETLRQVSHIENKNLAENLKVRGMEGSALTGANVKDAFLQIIRDIRTERKNLHDKLDQLKKLHKKSHLRKKKRKGISASIKETVDDDIVMFGSSHSD